MLSYQNTSEQVSSGTQKYSETIELVPRSVIERNPHLFLFSSSSSTSDLPNHRHAEPNQIISFIESSSDYEESKEEIKVDLLRIRAAPQQPEHSIDKRAFEDPSILNTRFLTTSNNQTSSNQFWRNMLGGAAEQTQQSLFRSNEEIPSTIVKGLLTNNFFQTSEFIPAQNHLPQGSSNHSNSEAEEIIRGYRSLCKNNPYFSEGDDDQLVDDNLIQIDA